MLLPKTQYPNVRFRQHELTALVIDLGARIGVDLHLYASTILIRRDLLREAIAASTFTRLSCGQTTQRLMLVTVGYRRVENRYRLTIRAWAMDVHGYVLLNGDSTVIFETNRPGRP